MKRLQSRLKELCKDFGLSEAAIDDLARSVEGIDNASDDELEAKATSLAQMAKLMQAEVTRKLQSKKTEPKVSEPKVEAAPTEPKSEGEPEWFKAYMDKLEQKMQAIEAENTAFKAAKARADRDAAIEAKAKAMGITDSALKYVKAVIGDDADEAAIVKELTDFKQQQVASALPEDRGMVVFTSEEAMKADAEAFVQSLKR